MSTSSNKSPITRLESLLSLSTDPQQLSDTKGWAIDIYPLGAAQYLAQISHSANLIKSLDAVKGVSMQILPMTLGTLSSENLMKFLGAVTQSRDLKYFMYFNGDTGTSAEHLYGIEDDSGRRWHSKLQNTLAIVARQLPRNKPPQSLEF